MKSKFNWYASFVVSVILFVAGANIFGAGPVKPKAADDSKPAVVQTAEAGSESFPAFGVCVPAHCYIGHDGDTLYVETTFRYHVRLLDCWAPELNEPGGKEARDELQKVAVDKDLKVWIPIEELLRAIKPEQRDLGDLTTMGRFLARVKVDGMDESLSEHMIRLRLAARKKGNPLGQ